jgi:hypothetical protein
MFLVVGKFDNFSDTIILIDLVLWDQHFYETQIVSTNPKINQKLASLGNTRIDNSAADLKLFLVCD